MRQANDEWDDDDDGGMLSDDVQALADAIEDLKWSFVRTFLPQLRAARAIARAWDRFVNPPPRRRVNQGRHVMRTRGWGAGLPPAGHLARYFNGGRP